MTTKTKPKPPAKKAAPRRRTVEKPSAPALPSTSRITMLASDLKRVIAAVAIAASTDECRPILCGLRLRLNAVGTITWTTTDSYRIHHAVTTVDECQFGANPEALIPAAWLLRWARTPWNRLALVHITWDAERVTLTVDDEATSTRLIGGTYPDTDKLLENLPDVSSQEAGFNPKLIAQVFTACAKFAPDMPVRCTAFDPLKPSRWQVLGSPKGSLTCILMPVRLPS